MRSARKRERVAFQSASRPHRKRMGGPMNAAVLERFDVAGMLTRLGVSPRRITADSRAVRAGDAFAAFPGGRVDGRSFIGDAIGRGAAAVLWEAGQFAWKREWNVPNQPVEGLQQKLGGIADFIYGSPSAHMWMVGVTGTNGKTTCAHAVAQCFDHRGERAAVVGTLGNGLLGAVGPATHTTPDAPTLHEMLARFRREGAKAVAMEVSSHALDQGRVNGV